MIAFSRLVPVGVLALGACAAGAVAHAAGGGAAGPVRSQIVRAPVPALPAPGRTVTAVPAPAAVAIAPTLAGMPAPVCGPRPLRAPAGDRTPPSDALKDAFGILRSERSDEDALPANALAALKSRGLAPVDPGSARLLRSDGGGRAWVVPVPDVAAAGMFACGPRTAARSAMEGLAVVALGGAPAGGGGGLRELQRGTAPASVDLCAGGGHDMLGVSGVVPDGVDAVFVTAADGTATRADVHDNGYVFVLPRSKRIEVRYLVWTGQDGVPHVQPLPAVPTTRGMCARVASSSSHPPPHVTPEGLGAGCAAVAVSPRVVIAPPIGHTPRIARAVPRRPSRRVSRVPAAPAPMPRPSIIRPAPVTCALSLVPAAPGAPVVAVPPRPRRGP